MRVLTAVTSLLGDLAHQVKSKPQSKAAASVVKRYGDSTPSQSRIRGHKLLAIRAAHFRYNPLCVHCKAEGRVTIATELDHIVALSNGGLDFDRDDGENRQGLCTEHHARKTAADLGYEYVAKQTVGLDGWPMRARPWQEPTGAFVAPAPTLPHTEYNSLAPGGEGGAKLCKD